MSSQSTDDGEQEKLAEGTLISHLVELRSRIMRAMLAIVVIAVALLPFAQQIFTFVSRPIQEALPEGSALIVTGVAQPFLTPFKTTLFVALFAAMPVVIYQAWAFVAPGLYRNEKRFAVPIVVSSVVLFYLGVAFAYFVVFNLVFRFFIGVTPEGVVNAPDIEQYLSFVLRIFFAFGLAFEVPIVAFMLVWSRLVSIATLSKARPYIFLGAFVVGMLLTPPDVVSQTLLAIPIYLLYESGLVMARVMLGKELAERAAAEADDDDDEAASGGGESASGGGESSASTATASTEATIDPTADRTGERPAHPPADTAESDATTEGAASGSTGAASGDENSRAPGQDDDQSPEDPERESGEPPENGRD